jgi:hypothetical protein
MQLSLFATKGGMKIILVATHWRIPGVRSCIAATLCSLLKMNRGFEGGHRLYFPTQKIKINSETRTRLGNGLRAGHDGRADWAAGRKGRH